MSGRLALFTRCICQAPLLKQAERTVFRFMPSSVSKSPLDVYLETILHSFDHLSVLLCHHLFITCRLQKFTNSFTNPLSVLIKEFLKDFERFFCMCWWFSVPSE